MYEFNRFNRKEMFVYVIRFAFYYLINYLQFLFFNVFGFGYYYCDMEWAQNALNSLNGYYLGDVIDEIFRLITLLELDYKRNFCI